MTTATFLLSLLLADGLPPVEGLADLRSAGLSSSRLVDEPGVAAYLPLPEPAGEGMAEDLEEEENADLPHRPLEDADHPAEPLKPARPAAHSVAWARIRSPRSPPAAE